MIQNKEQVMESIEVLRNAEIESEKGLPEELFLLVSGLVPLPNVDLLIVNKQGQILLSRRNDQFFQNSWHIIGGCMRYGEDFKTRVEETAKREIGTTVSMEEDPVAVRNVIRGRKSDIEHSRERGHTVAMLFRCSLPEEYVIDNGDLTEKDEGYLKWFDSLPEDFMKIQYVYSDVLKPWMK